MNKRIVIFPWIAPQGEGWGILSKDNIFRGVHREGV